jgi:predicted nuclease of restriction endonuclease-like (RecB) superfamily
MAAKKPKKVDDTRRSIGRARPEARVPASPPLLDLPSDYPSLLQDLKRRIETERLRVTLAANAAMVLLYWDIGRAILQRQEREGWGAKVIDRLSVDLRDAFPDMQGLSPRNLKYMRAFAEAWSDQAIVQATLAQITWYHNLALLEKLKTPEERLWYAAKTIEFGWSRNILTLQIARQLHQRQGKAITNFPAALPPPESDMAAQVFKDPYLFDFLGTADPRREREVERALIEHVERFLLELGQGFAFVGRQKTLEVGDSDFLIDLLFYHYILRCFVVVELKTVPFDPAFVGQLNLYLSAVDDLLRQPGDKPTIGLLLCKGKDRTVAEYALRGFQKPIGVADWETQIVTALPEELRASLPTVEQIEAELQRLEAPPPPTPKPKKPGRKKKGGGE